MDIKQKIDTTIERLKDGVNAKGAKKVSCSFSGGHDSVLAGVLTQMAFSDDNMLAPYVWANTLTGAWETKQYIYYVRDLYGWELIESKPTQKGRYEQFIMTYGFPSPAIHSWVYRELKGKVLYPTYTKLYKSLGLKSRLDVAQVTGLRQAESTRRANFVQLVNEQKTKTGRVTDRLFNPLYDWQKWERDEAIAHLGIPRNLFAVHMQHSYECQCMANMATNERDKRKQVNRMYEEIDLKREELVKVSMELQDLLVQSGVWDEEDRTLKHGRNVQGWHLKEKYTPKDVENNDNFNLCQSCTGDRALDGTGGFDPDLVPTDTTFEDWVEQDAELPIQDVKFREHLRSLYRTRT